MRSACTPNRTRGGRRPWTCSAPTGITSSPKIWAAPSMSAAGLAVNWLGSQPDPWASTTTLTPSRSRRLPACRHTRSRSFWRLSTAGRHRSTHCCWPMSSSTCPATRGWTSCECTCPTSNRAAVELPLPARRRESIHLQRDQPGCPAATALVTSEAQALQLFRVTLPVLGHLDVQVEEHLDPEQLLDRSPRRAAD